MLRLNQQFWGPGCHIYILAGLDSQTAYVQSRIDYMIIMASLRYFMITKSIWLQHEKQLDFFLVLAVQLLIKASEWLVVKPEAFKRINDCSFFFLFKLK